MRPRTLAVRALAILVGAVPPSASAQVLPLAPVRGARQSVTPAFEGWYRNADGTYTISFGYFNRNADETISVPRGPRNHIEPEEYDGAQPDLFEPRRHWGVFGVVVPADFPAGAKVYWTIEANGEELRVPGHLKTEWEIDALAGEAGSGNTPPTLRFGEASGAGPLGVTSPQVLHGQVGVPVALEVWAEDDGRPDNSVASAGRRDVPVTLTWRKHQGPGTVTFSEATGTVEVSGGEMTTQATFDAPGDYVLRVLANDASGVSGAGHAQCCWTNGYVRVRITR